MNYLFLVTLLIVGCGHKGLGLQKSDPLSSWSETPVKKSIKSFVEEVTNPDSKRFIPKEDRIATFDNDGTLWAEQPSVELLFTEFQSKDMNIKHEDISQMDQKEVAQLVMRTHTGMTEEEFSDDVHRF